MMRGNNLQSLTKHLITNYPIKTVNNRRLSRNHNLLFISDFALPIN